MHTSNFPIKLIPNRVWRIYSGGKLLDRFCGNSPELDTMFPEDWLGSVVVANNLPREGKPEKEGLSLCEDGEYLRDKIMADPERMLGREHVAAFGTNLSVLVKFLDSAVRLPIQVHPDRAKARELFDSAYGKTEAWYILDGRELGGEKPYILMGFKEHVTPELWKECFETQDIEKMENCLHKFYVKPGEVFLIRGGTPHAIGSGCFLLEIQEPTDYTISVEKKAPDGSVVSDYMCDQGIGFDRMFECFHYDALSEKAVKDICGLEPVLADACDAAKTYDIIGAKHTEAFRLSKIDAVKDYTIPTDNQAYVFAVTDGCAKLICGDKVTELKRGDSVFMPANTQNAVLMPQDDSVTLLVCKPPKA